MTQTTISASGILFYRKKHQTIEILVGKCVKSRWGPSAWTIFGGRKESRDINPRDTAIREFNEETAGIFSYMINEVDLYDIITDSPYIDIKNSKYRLYFISVDDNDLNEYLYNVHDRFQRALSYTLPSFMREMCEIDWWPYTIINDNEITTNFVHAVIGRNRDIRKFFDDLYYETYEKHRRRTRS